MYTSTSTIHIHYINTFAFVHLLAIFFRGDHLAPHTPRFLPPCRIEKRAELTTWNQATSMTGDHRGYTDYPFMDA